MARLVRALFVVSLVVVAVPIVAHAVPPAVGADHSYVVMSGSMEPNIPVGSVVWVEDVPAAQIQKGDVITFVTSSTGPPTTHRVVYKAGTGENATYVTKGDANEGPDAETIPQSNVVGEVVYVVPYLGQLIIFASSRNGILLMVVVPSGLLIADELRNLYREVTDGEDSSEGEHVK